MPGVKKYDRMYTLNLSSTEDADIIEDIESTPGNCKSDQVRNYVRLHSGTLKVAGITIKMKKKESRKQKKRKQTK